MTPRLLPVAALAAVLLIAGHAGAAHWPGEGGDAGHSGNQPVHPAALGNTPAPLAFAPVTSDAGAPRSSLVDTGPDDPTQQLVAYTRYIGGPSPHAYVHLRSLLDGTDRIAAADQDIDDSDATDSFGAGSVPVSPVDASDETSLGELYVVYNDDDSDAQTDNGCNPLSASTASDNDIAIAQFDEATGARTADVAVGRAQGTPPDPTCPLTVQVSDGYTIESSPVLTPPLDATGTRMLFFLAASDAGGDPRLFGVTIDQAGTADAVMHATTPQVRDVPGANPLASPTLAYLHAPGRPNAAPVLYVAVPFETGGQAIRTFQFNAIDDPTQDGPIAGAVAGTPQTISVPVTASGLIPGAPGSGVSTAPALYAAFGDAAANTTTVRKFVQGANPANLVEASQTTPTAVEGYPSPALALSAIAAPEGEQAGRVVVATGLNLVLLNAETLTPVDRYLDAGQGHLVPGATGFSRTIPLTSGGLIFLSSDRGAQEVFGLADGEPVAQGFVESAGNNLSQFALGQAAYSNGRLQFLDDSGLFVYQVAIQPPPTSAPPVARFTVSPNPASPGQTVTFDGGGSSDADGTVVTYEWDLDGDGTFEKNTGQTATTTAAYDRPGTYHAALRVTDNDGATATTAGDVVVATAGAGNTPPSASFAIAPNPARAGSTVTFDASASSDADGAVASYQWDFDGNGSFETHTGTRAKVSRVYQQGGVFNIKLRVTDNAGATTDVVHQLTVTGSAGACSPLKCKARLTARVTPGRDAQAPYRFVVAGRLRLPARVAAAQGCNGRVGVAVKAGGRTLLRRVARVSRRCRYRTHVIFDDADAFGASRTLTIAVRFRGNALLRPRALAPRTARVR